jgi:hypothetical protein
MLASRTPNRDHGKMLSGYHERGGLRWGRSFWGGSNATWPFATLHLTPERVEVRVNAWLLRDTFVFTRADVKSFCKRRGLFSVGVQIDHQRPNYPPVIVFWTFHCRRLLAAAQEAGYTVHQEPSDT